MAGPSRSTCRSLETRCSEASALCCHLWACVSTTSHLGSLQLSTFCPPASRIATASATPGNISLISLQKLSSDFLSLLKKIKVLKVVSKACCDPDPQRPPGRVLSAPAGSLGSAELALVLRVTLSSGLSLLPLSTPVCAAPGSPLERHRVAKPSVRGRPPPASSPTGLFTPRHGLLTGSSHWAGSSAGP